MNRRGFFQSLAAGACGTAIGAVISEEQTKEPELHLFHAGFMARVWLDGVEYEWVKSMVASCNPNDEVEGEIVIFALNSAGRPFTDGEGLVLIKKEGRVRWEHLFD